MTSVPSIREQSILSSKDKPVKSTIPMGIWFIQTAYLSALFQRVYWWFASYFSGVPIDTATPYIFQDTIRFKVQSSRDLSRLQGISPEDAYYSGNRI